MKRKMPNFNYRNYTKNILIAIVLSTITIIYMHMHMLDSKNIQTVSKVIENKKVILGGEVAGIRLLANGVLVMGIEPVKTEKGEVNTTSGVDIDIGDIILEVNDKRVETNKELINITENTKGEKMKLRISRKNKEHIVYIMPALSKKDKKYKLGLWVKDSSAGVGTITFYDKETNNFAALGHGITETKENYILPILTGGLASTSIININKGKEGSPGDLRGTLTTDIIAEIKLNTEYGIYGTYITNESFINKKEVEVLDKTKVKEGKAEIYCTLEDNKLEKYEVKIVKVIKDSINNKNMVIQVTDKRLKEKTGGIIQGMSGSPIVQNGKLVGAVTHVFLNEPTKGYGVFIENMLNDIQNVN